MFIGNDPAAADLSPLGACCRFIGENLERLRQPAGVEPLPDGLVAELAGLAREAEQAEMANLCGDAAVARAVAEVLGGLRRRG